MVYEKPETERAAVEMGERLRKMSDNQKVMDDMATERRNHDVFGN
jgi:hypothetical protein